MNNLRNSSNLRSTKAAIAGTTIAIMALAGAYFHNEFEESKVIAYVTRPSYTTEIKATDDYYNNLTFTKELEETKVYSR